METPGVILINPKYQHNVGGALRACSCFGMESLLWTGNRVVFDKDSKARIPREERMKGYRSVDWLHTQRPFDVIGGTPVAVEVLEASESMVNFEHPDDAVYIFGPEDGHVPQVIRRLCHRFIHIPAHHCLNLSAAVNVVLYDRRIKRIAAGKEKLLPLNEMLREHRGYHEPPTPILEEIGWSGR